MFGSAGSRSPFLNHATGFLLNLIRTLLLGISMLASAAVAQTTAATLALEENSTAANPTTPAMIDAGGAVRLRQPTPAATPRANDARDDRRTPMRIAYVPGEFERFVQKQADAGVEVRRFGAELSIGIDSQADLSPLVPDDYLISVGDEVLIILWGSVDADLRLTVDRGGRISIPRVGVVQVAGVRYSELRTVVSRRVAQSFKNYEISVSLGQLRGIRVFVTGFVTQPGSYAVSSLSTVLGALLRAGGPAASGSFRQIELRRGGRLVSSFDLYDLLLKGDRSADAVIQAGDVIHVGPVGLQVGIVGSVNKPAIIELKPGETVADVLRIAGGFTAVADRSRLTVERLQERRAQRIAEIGLPAGLTQLLSEGDVLRAFSAVDVTLPTQRQNKRVRVEGEVVRPGEYVVSESSSLQDLLRIAGGFTPSAYVFATEFTRVSVRTTQQENYDRALRDLETDLARNSASQRVVSTEEATAQAARSTGINQLVDRLRTLRPTGRVVLNIEPSSTSLPDLALEDGDRIYVPPRATVVGVYGSVFNSASYIHAPGRKLGDYLRLAGGPTKGADEDNIFLVRANGSVISGRQRSSGWLSSTNTLGDLSAEPGDTVFVPEELNKTTLVQNLKDWTQIFSQFGLGIAAIRVLGN